MQRKELTIPETSSREGLRDRQVKAVIGSNKSVDRCALLGPTPESPWMLVLYVAGRSSVSLRAFSNLTRICEELLPGKCRIELVDIMEDPSRAHADGIEVVPTLIKKSPGPPARIVGDLRQAGPVIRALFGELERTMPEELANVVAD